MAIQEICRVAECARLGEGLYSVTMHAPAICAQTQIGQFVHIACGEGNLLRRPISICDWQDGNLRVVFQVKGEGTKWLAERKAGDELDVLGPLGHGFDTVALGAKPVFIGGGSTALAARPQSRSSCFFSIPTPSFRLILTVYGFLCQNATHFGANTRKRKKERQKPA